MAVQFGTNPTVTPVTEVLQPVIGTSGVGAGAGPAKAVPPLPATAPKASRPTVTVEVTAFIKIRMQGPLFPSTSAIASYVGNCMSEPLREQPRSNINAQYSNVY